MPATRSFCWKAVIYALDMAEVLQGMLDGLARLREQGLDVIYN